LQKRPSVLVLSGKKNWVWEREAVAEKGQKKKKKKNKKDKGKGRVCLGRVGGELGEVIPSHGLGGGGLARKSLRTGFI